MQGIMRAKSSAVLAVVAIMLGVVGMLFPGSGKNTWIPGQVISTGLHGHGKSGNENYRSIRSKDIWWSYCISSGEMTYSALSRENPVRAGLKENSLIKLMERQNQIYVLNSAGQRIALKIIRKGKGKKCT
jgi:hypothetical protein